MTAVKKKAPKNKAKQRRARVPQTDIPAHTLKDALRVPRAIFDNYAGDPTTPLKVAQALDLSPTSSTFRMITGASAAFGLTNGAAQSSTIETTPLSKRIFRAQSENDDLIAKREAFVKPRIINEFLTKYDNSAIPPENIAVNVLEDMGAPRERALEVFRDLIEGADDLSLTTMIKSKKYVMLEGIDQDETLSENLESEIVEFPIPDIVATEGPSEIKNAPKTIKTSAEDDPRFRRVFITHGKNKSLVEPIRQLLDFGALEAVVSVEKQSVSQPVPEKVMDDMRSCGAAIIHVEGEETLMANDGEQRIVLNPNVLIEIGAAMALYKKRFILLTKDGVKLPSNLQGLYEVRYSSDGLDGDATIRLMKAINEMKKTK